MCLKNDLNNELITPEVADLFLSVNGLNVSALDAITDSGICSSMDARVLLLNDTVWI